MAELGHTQLRGEHARSRRHCAGQQRGVVTAKSLTVYVEAVENRPLAAGRFWTFNRFFLAPKTVCSTGLFIDRNMSVIDRFTVHSESY